MGSFKSYAAGVSQLETFRLFALAVSWHRITLTSVAVNANACARSGLPSNRGHGQEF